MPGTVLGPKKKQQERSGFLQGKEKDQSQQTGKGAWEKGAWKLVRVIGVERRLLL